MKKFFAVLWGHGAAWDVKKTVREQPYWDEHAEFMDRLFDEGMVLLAGPFADGTGSLVIFEAESESDLAALLVRDPFAVHDVFVLNALKEWQIFLDARQRSLQTPH